MNARRSILAGLLGRGVGPSLTPELHEREAARQGLRYVYKTVDLDDGQLDPRHLRELLRSAVELGFDGLNVTHPIKQAMVPLVDRVSSEVAAIGALNTVVVSDGLTTGHNSDVTGFTAAFLDGLPDADLGEVLLLGAGGAGTAVAHALAALGVRRLSVADPDVERVRALVRSLDRTPHQVQVDGVAPHDVPAALAHVAGLVNASPIGMTGHPGAPVDTSALPPGLWVADIVYRPLFTALLRDAHARGCRTLSGAGMAVHQAADTFELITGRPAHRADMFGDFDELVAAETGGDRHTPEAPAPGSPTRK
ncbi:shikimate dehydrogenase [Cellulomonas humilata]|uniref:Shikimate dehydrogenase n=1 Tax=Cellulomonas humilata TaxID=144055 RepID=A0A7Y5ZX83_9CELL|nr:shikimate dehydrogenase [Cellulomonas humilata]